MSGSDDLAHARGDAAQLQWVAGDQPSDGPKTVSVAQSGTP